MKSGVSRPPNVSLARLPSAISCKPEKNNLLDSSCAIPAERISGILHAKAQIYLFGTYDGGSVQSLQSLEMVDDEQTIVLSVCHDRIPVQIQDNQIGKALDDKILSPQS